jgi:hypothetical protein
MDNPSVVTKEFSNTTNIFDPNKNNNNIFIKKLKMRLEKI